MALVVTPQPARPRSENPHFSRREGERRPRTARRPGAAPPPLRPTLSLPDVAEQPRELSPGSSSTAAPPRAAPLADPRSPACTARPAPWHSSAGDGRPRPRPARTAPCSPAGSPPCPGEERARRPRGCHAAHLAEPGLTNSSRCGRCALRHP